MNRRVVITGFGAIAPNGIGKEAFWEALKEGRSGVDKVTYFDSSIVSCHLAAEARDFKANSFLPAKIEKRTDRSTQLAIAATTQAFKDSKLELTNKLKEEFNVLIGTAMSGHVSYIEQMRAYFTKGYKAVSPVATLACFTDACSGQLSIFFGLKGPVETVCAAQELGINKYLPKPLNIGKLKEIIDELTK